MTTYKVVVDGSNIATEGRSLPSLSQLDEAVQAFIEEHPGADVLVIVDTSFPNRIDKKELAIFEAAYAAGEIITPPAGTIGRGDSFILKVADKLGATVFSNDSFQEFHGTYDWLFEKGRLEGGKPIPGYGWIFTGRTPVRGPKSRDAVRESKRSVARIGSPEAMRPMPIPKSPPPSAAKTESAAAVALEVAEETSDRRGKRRGKSRVHLDEKSTVAARPELRVDGVDDEERKKKKKKRKRKPGGSGGEGTTLLLESVNEPLAFINFISEHLLGSELDGVVSTYSSHGFYVDAAGARCYVPLSGLATPMPRSAKEVVRKGESYRYVVTAFDSARRGIELALIGTPGAEAYGLVANATPDSSVGAGSDDVQVKAPDAMAPDAKAKPQRPSRKPTASVDATNESETGKSGPSKPRAANERVKTVSPLGPNEADTADVKKSSTNKDSAPVVTPSRAAKSSKKATTSTKTPVSKANVATPPSTKSSGKKPTTSPALAKKTVAKAGSDTAGSDTAVPVKAVPVKAVPGKSVVKKEIAKNEAVKKAVLAKGPRAKSPTVATKTPTKATKTLSMAPAPAKGVAKSMPAPSKVKKVATPPAVVGVKAVGVKAAAVKAAAVKSPTIAKPPVEKKIAAKNPVPTKRVKKLKDR